MNEPSTICFRQMLCNNVHMDWDDLRFVLALARHRTLSSAAKALGGTHTTVARRLRGIEKALGSRLFDASDAGYTPTAAGQLAIEVAGRTEVEMLALEARVLGGDTKLEGKLRVSTMDMLFCRFDAVFKSFLERYPSIELTIGCSDSEVSLMRRESDVALRMTNAPAGNLVGRKVGRVDFAVYASRTLARRVGPRAAFSQFPWLHWDERLGARWLDAWLAEHAPGARIAMRVDVSSLALREVIAAGIGVHLLACSEGDRDTRLCRIGAIQAVHSRDVWMLTMSELRTSSRVRALMDHFVESAVAR
jgi:DNA-binding transcriptional LysR family regulator